MHGHFKPSSRSFLSLLFTLNEINVVALYVISGFQGTAYKLHSYVDAYFGRKACGHIMFMRLSRPI